MKVGFQNFDTKEMLGEWELNKSQEKFWNSTKKFVLMSGGFGCVSGDTKILNADSLKEIRIDEIHSPIRVFSHNGKKAWALTPVKYDPQPLFKVKTNSYEFTGTANHAVFTVSGWKKVSELLVGELLLVSPPFLPHSTSESFLSILFSNVLHWIRTVQGFLYGYHPVFRFYDGRPRLVKGIALSSFPSQPYVHERNPQSFFAGENYPLPKCSQTYLQSFLPSKSDFFPLKPNPLVSDEGGHTFSRLSGYFFALTQWLMRFLWNTLTYPYRVLINLCNIFYSPYSYPTIKEEKIQSISPCGVDNYYDLHVLGTHSYYAQGFFHHNSGKSLMLTIKAIDFSLRYPNNYILMGRRTYPELRDTLLKEFFTICPDVLIKDYLKAEGRVIFPNKSEIIFRHLDTIAESEIRSMNLGAAFIDQAEDIEKAVFEGLRGRLRREGVDDKDRRIYLSCNPALNWLYADFKQHPGEDYEVIESSTLDNEKNLPKAYIDDLLKYPESYKKQYVYGIWDENLLSDRIVFAREYIEKLGLYVMEPIKQKEGLDIFKEFEEGHDYQMGIDTSEGIVEEGVAQEKQKSDESAITITDLTTEEEVASWSGRLPPDVVAEKAIQYAHFYSTKKYPIKLIPEMNSIGLALVNRLNRESSDYIRIYRREEFDKKTGQRSEKEGWRTTRQTKPLLISRFQELLRVRDPKIRSKRTYEQFKTFVHTAEANKQGMGGEKGFHDDRIISFLLSFWRKGPVSPGTVSSHREKERGIIIRNGKITIPQLTIEKENSWKSN